MKKMKNCLISLLILFLAVGLVLAAAPGVFGGMQGGSYAITADVVSGGGGTMASESYQLQSTIGQPTPIMDQEEPPYSTSYNLYPGFWYTLETGPACVNLAVFAASFGSVNGDINYSLSCDLDGDDDVDGSDLVDFMADL